MTDLRRKLNDKFDPTDANKASDIAWHSLLLMEVCERVLFAERHGMRIGRDDSAELALRMRTLGQRLGLLDIRDSTSISDFHTALAPGLKFGGVEGVPQGEQRERRLKPPSVFCAPSDSADLLSPVSPNDFASECLRDSFRAYELHREELLLLREQERIEDRLTEVRAKQGRTKQTLP